MTPVAPDVPGLVILLRVAGRVRAAVSGPGRISPAMMAFAYTLIGLLVLTSILLTMLVLLHRGKGGGLSSMFGGGVSSSLAGSSVAEKNLDRYTVLVGIIWFACIVGLGLWLKVAMATGAS
jgi:preprotein translocase subunit SecG